MSSYENKDPMQIAKQAERELDTHQAKQGGYNNTDSANESGVSQDVESRFEGAQVQYGSAASGREIPPEEGGSTLRSGRITKDSDFEGEGGPEGKERQALEERGGDDDVRGNVRQGGETRDGAVRNS